MRTYPFQIISLLLFFKFLFRHILLCFMEALDFIAACIIIKVFYVGELSKKIPIPSSNLLFFFPFKKIL